MLRTWVRTGSSSSLVAQPKEVEYPAITQPALRWATRS